MSISNISGQPAGFATLVGAPSVNSAGNTAALTGLIGGAGDAQLIANVEGASSGVSSAIQALSSALGSIINTTA